ncbi:NAD-dependent epimerase/dehydratase family protein [Ferrovibrio sp.]|uniref:NAD-dependent epimerase/dehydratase family protein n=1 Tax=Ferrovibrio sp. TaxID=1917215 RepID=UPI003D26959B
MTAPSALPPFQSGQRVVVTGGAGFIGSHLVEALLARGVAVTVLDDFSAGRRANLPAHPQLDIREAHVGRDDIRAAIAGAQLVYHLASPIGVRRAHAERLTMVREIIAASEAVTAACEAARVPLLAMSSSEVYGAGQAEAIDEEQPCGFGIAPRWGYAAGKMVLEQLCAGLAGEAGLATWIVRPFNIAGPRQRPETGLCIAAFAAALKQGDAPEVHGDGSQRRAFLHVLDAVEALLLIPQSAALIGRPVNLGHDTGVSIRHVAERALHAARSDKPPRFVPVAQVFGSGFAEATIRVPTIARLHEATGWRPRRDLDAILQDVLL